MRTPIKITYKIIGENILISIPFATGNREILEKTVVVPDGDRCILYKSYLYQ